MPTPIKQNIVHYAGDTLGILIRLYDDVAKTQPSNLTGTIVTAQVRATPQSVEAEADFAVSVLNNTITLILEPKRTREIPPSSVWDCQVDWDASNPDTNVQTVVAGSLTLQPDVTRTVAP